MAPGDAASSKDRTVPGPVALERFDRVLRARWIESANCGKQRTEEHLIDTNTGDDDLTHLGLPSRSLAVARAGDPGHPGDGNSRDSTREALDLPSKLSEGARVGTSLCPDDDIPGGCNREQV